MLTDFSEIIKGKVLVALVVDSLLLTLVKLGSTYMFKNKVKFSGLTELKALKVEDGPL